MTRSTRAFAGSLLTAVLAIVPTTLRAADTVQLTVHDGRVSLVATNATPAQIFDAWSRAGGVLVVNAERMPVASLTLTLDNVPEEQALDTLLRPVSGYLARRKTDPQSAGSIFDRIVILATPAAARQTTAAPAPPIAAQRPGPRGTPVFPQPPPPAAGQPGPAAVAAPNGVPQGPGVTRLFGPDGQPVEDDQAGAPPPAPYNGGDSPDARPAVGAPRGVPGAPPQPAQQQPQPQAQPQPQPPSTSAPAGVSRPGMVVPAPTQQPQR